MCWLLNHDPNERPTSKELLQSDYIPPPQMEEAELNEILRATISDPHSKSYRRMINAMFSQSVSLADDHIYDSDLQKVRKSLFPPHPHIPKRISVCKNLKKLDTPKNYCNFPKI